MKLNHSWALYSLSHIREINFKIFYETRRQIILYMNARHWSLSWAKGIQPVTSEFFIRVKFNIILQFTPR
jgi:hypothetical protein